MKLPNAGQAIVAEEKLTHYLLDLSSKAGWGKAKFFLARGFTLENWYAFREALLRHASEHEVSIREDRDDGAIYKLDGEMRMPNGRSDHVHSVWMIDQGKHQPRLISAYKKKRGVR